MKAYIFALIFTLQVCVPAFGAVDVKTDAQYAPGLRVTKNFVKNPDCEKNTLNITSGAGVLTQNTSTPLVAGAGTQCRWNPASASTLKFDISTLSPNVKAGNCEASFYTGANTAGEFVAYIEYDSVQVTSDLALNATVAGQKYSIQAPCGSSVTTRKLVIRSTTSPSPLLIGGVSFGESLSFGNVSRIDDWQSFTPTGSWSANTTYTGKWRRVGDTMEVQVLVSTSGAPTSATLTVNLPSGYSIDTTKLVGSSMDTTYFGGGAVLDGGVNNYVPVKVGYSSTTAVLGYIPNASGTYATGSPITQAVPITFGSGDSVSLTFSVPISGWTSTQTAASVSQSLSLMGSVFYVASSTCPAGSLSADGSAVSRTGYAQLFNAIGTTYGTGDGSTTFNLPDLRGIFVRGAGSQTISSITYSGTLGTKQGDQMQGHFHVGKTRANGVNGAADYRSSQTTTGGTIDDNGTNIGAPTTDGTNGTPRTGTETRPANISLTACISYVAVPAPLYVGSVSSNTTGMERIERALVTTACTSTPCTIASQTGSWLTSITRDSAGFYTANIASGIFSNKPSCFFYPIAGAVNAVLSAGYGGSGPTTTSFNFACVRQSATTTGEDCAFQIMCMGPR